MKFLDRLGVNVHMSYPTWNTQKANAQAAIDWLGIRHVRDMWGYGLASLQRVEQLVICENAAQTNEAIAKYGATAVEGPNEQNSKVTDAKLRAAQAEVYKAAAGRVPVLSCSINAIHPYATLGQVAADVASLHIYRGNVDLPTFTARRDRALTTEAAMVAPWRRAWVTETGWFDAPGARSTTAQQAAAQFLETVRALWAGGSERVYLYELWDDSGQTVPEQATYGLFTKDWKPKPLAATVKAFLATFGAYDDLSVLDLAPKINAARTALA